MPPQNGHEYDFIMQPPQNKRSGPAFLQNPKQSKVILVLFVLVVFFVLIVGYTLVSNIGKESQDDLLRMISYQSEIVRVSELGLQTSTDLSTRNSVSTIDSFIKSDQSSTVSYLENIGFGIPENQFTFLQNTATDEALNTALQTGRYDEELQQQLDFLLQDYARVIGTSLSNVDAVNKQALLNQAADNLRVYYGSEN